ncbi:MAG: hypothetical protein OHK0038_23980 [Flammeovirgaceae bacterium]
MNKTIITTVGTSLISNWKETNKFGLTEEIRQQLKELEGSSFFEVSATTMDNYINYIKGEYIEKGILQLLKEFLNAKSDCAEISSITAIENELRKSLKEGEELNLTIHLLCTDTILSPLCAEVIAGYLRTKGYNVAFHEQENIVSEIKNSNFKSEFIIRDLRVDNKEKFEKKGLITLIEKFYSIVEQNCEFDTVTNEYRPSCILNITGGYKGLIPYLTIFSQISKVKICYLFEDTNDIIQIPQASISLDWNFIAQNSSIFNDLANVQVLERTEDWQTYKQQHNVPDTFDNYYSLLSEQDGTKLLGLNAIGTILHKELGNYFFVEIPINSRYFKDEFSIKKEVNKAIKDLYYKLSNLSEPFNTLTDPLLKHCNIDDTTVYKDTSSHLRIQYVYSQSKKALCVINYYYKRETDEYQKIMKQEYASTYKEAELTILPFKKTL